MKALETTFDNLIGCNYTLYSVKYSELRDLVRGWYDGYNLKEFDNKYVGERYEIDFKVIRKSGLLTNLFYAQKKITQRIILAGD